MFLSLTSIQFLILIPLLKIKIMKTNLLMVLIFFFHYFEGNSQIFNIQDSTYYTDSSFVKLYDGELVSFYTLNGAVQSKSNFVAGKLHGESISYYENGKVSKKLNFEHGKYHGDLLEFHPNGQVSKKTTYSYGVPNGELIKYHENGKIEGKVTYIEGDLHGEWFNFYENGAIRGKGSYLKGKIHGETIWYDTDGKVSNFYAIPLNW